MHSKENPKPTPRPQQKPYCHTAHANVQRLAQAAKTKHEVIVSHTVSKPQITGSGGGIKNDFENEQYCHQVVEGEKS